jgi:predicted dehydrogenase
MADLKLGSSPPHLQLAKGDEPFRPLPIPNRFLTGVDATQPFITQFLSMFTAQPIGCRLFIDVILENRPLVPSFYEGWKAQQAIDATIAAHERGHWMAV